MTVQSRFNVTLPTTDNSGAALVTGQLTAIIFGIGAATFPYTLPAGTALGATLAVPFRLVGFTPAGGSTYTADAYAVDINGDGVPCASITWTEETVPAAPTGFSVS